MNDGTPAPIKIRRGYNGRIRRRWWINQWPYLVWAGLCVLAAVLYIQSPQPGNTSVIRGVVENDAVSIAPVETARIKAIAVAEGQKVKAGDILVEMDTALVDHGVMADLIDIRRIEVSFGDTHQDVLQAVSQRLDAISAIEADMAECRQEWRREAAELAALQKEQARREVLRGERLIDETTRSELLPSIAGLEQAVAEYPRRMETMTKQLSQAQRYYGDIMTWLEARDAEPVSEAIRRKLKESQIGKLLNEAGELATRSQQAYVLRAPRDGVVSTIFFRAGDVVAASMPVLRIVAGAPSRIVAYLGEEQSRSLGVGDRVRVHSAWHRALTNVYAVVEGIGPEIHASAYETTLTGRTVPMRARRSQLRILGTHDLIGGESVLLRLPLRFPFACLGDRLDLSRR